MVVSVMDERFQDWDVEQAYSCQAAVDADSQVIVARSVSNKQSDMHELAPILDQIKHNVGRQARDFSADMGYCCEENLKTLKRRRIRGYVATGRRRPEKRRRLQRWPTPGYLGGGPGSAPWAEAGQAPRSGRGSRTGPRWRTLRC